MDQDNIHPMGRRDTATGGQYVWGRLSREEVPEYIRSLARSGGHFILSPGAEDQMRNTGITSVTLLFALKRAEFVTWADESGAWRFSALVDLGGSLRIAVEPGTLDNEVIVAAVVRD